MRIVVIAAAIRVKGVRSRLPAAAVLASLALASNASIVRTARSAGSVGSDPELSEIVVTAEKRVSTVQSTPISITALSGDALQSEGITSVSGVAQLAPGISMRTSGPGQTEFEMRGLASTGGAAPTVGFYMDEVPLTPPAAALNGKVVIDPNLFDLNRVEVLRGPQGTLYGAGSMGGTIKLVTNSPRLNVLEGEVQSSLSGTEGGGFNRGGNLMLNLPLMEDRLAARVVVTDQYTDGWIDRVVVSPFPIGPGGDCGFNVCTRGNVQNAPVIKRDDRTNWEHLQSIRASLLFKLSDTTTIQPMAMYQTIYAGGYSEFDSPPGASAGLVHYQPNDLGEPFSDRFALFSLTATHAFDGAELTGATSYFSRQQRQSANTSEQQYYLLGTFYGLTGFPVAPYTESDRTLQRSAELRLASTADTRFQWIFGGFFSSFESVFDQYAANPDWADLSTGGAAANPLGIAYQAHNPYLVKQYALFGETSYKISDTVKATVGLRWFKFDTEVDYETSGIYTSSGNSTPVAGVVSSADRGFNPRFNLAYIPDGDLTTYATIAKGFRPGGVNLPIPTFCNSSVPLAYNSDSIWNFELGEKTRLFDGALTVNGDVFYVDWSNIQQYLTLPCSVPLSLNAGNARSYGPEIEIYGRISTGLTLGLSGNYTKSEITSVSPSAQGLFLAPNQKIEAGTPIENVPKYSVTGSLTYDRPFAGDTHLVARVSDTYVGPLYDIAYYFTELPGYNLLNTRLGLTHDHWHAYLFADNVTNQHPALSINTTTFYINIPALTRVATSQPRTIGVDLMYRF